MNMRAYRRFPVIGILAVVSFRTLAIAAHAAPVDTASWEGVWDYTFDLLRVGARPAEGLLTDVWLAGGNATLGAMLDGDPSQDTMLANHCKLWLPAGSKSLTAFALSPTWRLVSY